MALTHKHVVSNDTSHSPDDGRMHQEDTRFGDGDPAAVAAAWDAEVKRRIRELDADQVTTLPVEDVLAELCAKLQ